jgi:hypothetical protein
MVRNLLDLITDSKPRRECFSSRGRRRGHLVNRHLGKLFFDPGLSVETTSVGAVEEWCRCASAARSMVQCRLNQFAGSGDYSLRQNGDCPASLHGNSEYSATRMDRPDQSHGRVPHTQTLPRWVFGMPGMPTSRRPSTEPRDEAILPPLQ